MYLYTYYICLCTKTGPSKQVSNHRRVFPIESHGKNSNILFHNQLYFGSMPYFFFTSLSLHLSSFLSTSTFPFLFAFSPSPFSFRPVFSFAVLNEKKKQSGESGIREKQIQIEWEKQDKGVEQKQGEEELTRKQIRTKGLQGKGWRGWHPGKGNWREEKIGRSAEIKSVRYKLYFMDCHEYQR